jgi:hypothetical protein
MEKKRTYPTWIVAALLALMLPTLYMGSYYALLDDQNGWATEGEFVPVFRTRRRVAYRTNAPLIKQFFIPAHWLDRQFRRDYWRWYHEGEEFLP